MVTIPFICRAEFYISVCVICVLHVLLSLQTGGVFTGADTPAQLLFPMQAAPRNSGYCCGNLTNYTS